MNKTISTVFTLLSPLSHIGESQGVDSYLNTQQIVNGDNIEEVFVYTGNAIRGQLRDSGAKYLLKDKKVKNDLFYLLFSGGNIAGEQKTDIEKALEIRNKLPLISILGGGIGSALLAGKLYISDGYPLCNECINIVPEELKKLCNKPYGVLTSERSYTRFDDSKNELMVEYREETEQKEKKKGEASTQMRYTVEVLSAGSKIWNMIECDNLSKVEMGCLVASLEEMFQTPYLGGKKNVGMGRFEAEMKMDDEVFIRLNKEGIITLSDKAREYKKLYDDHIETVNLEEVIL